VQQEDIIKEIKKHSFYMKPGEKRRAKRSAFAEATAQESSGGKRIKNWGGPDPVGVALPFSSQLGAAFRGIRPP